MIAHIARRSIHPTGRTEYEPQAQSKEQQQCSPPANALPDRHDRAPNQLFENRIQRFCCKSERRGRWAHLWASALSSPFWLLFVMVIGCSWYCSPRRAGKGEKGREREHCRWLGSSVDGRLGLRASLLCYLLVIKSFDRCMDLAWSSPALRSVITSSKPPVNRFHVQIRSSGSYKPQWSPLDLLIAGPILYPLLRWGRTQMRCSELIPAIYCTYFSSALLRVMTGKFAILSASIG